MNNTTIGILSAIFILLGSWLVSSFTCGGGDAANFSLRDGALNIENVEPYSFGMNSAKLVLPSETSTAFKKIATHLQKNDTRTLSLIGNYFTSENTKNDTDLGLARAEAIKNKLVAMKAPESSITISSRRLNNIEGASDEAVVLPVDFIFAEKTSGSTSMDSDGGADVSGGDAASLLDGFVITYEDGKSSFEMTDELQSFMATAQSYINDNPDGKVVITGHTDDSRSTDRSETVSKSLAMKVRRLFRTAGFDRKNIEVIAKGKSELLEDSDLSRRIVLTME